MKKTSTTSPSQVGEEILQQVSQHHLIQRNHSALVLQAGDNPGYVSSDTSSSSEKEPRSLILVFRSNNIIMVVARTEN